VGNESLSQVRSCAEAVIARHSYFAGLAVVTVSIALMDWPDLALAIGGALNLVMCGALLTCATLAVRRDYRKTEVWQHLKHRIDMPGRTAQIVFGEALQSCYIRFARLFGVSATVFFAMASLWYAGKHFQYGGYPSHHAGAPAVFSASADDTVPTARQPQ
jgi:hypothetical protein